MPALSSTFTVTLTVVHKSQSGDYLRGAQRAAASNANTDIHGHTCTEKSDGFLHQKVHSSSSKGRNKCYRCERRKIPLITCACNISPALVKHHNLPELMVPLASGSKCWASLHVWVAKSRYSTTSLVLWSQNYDCQQGRHCNAFCHNRECLNLSLHLLTATQFSVNSLFDRLRWDPDRSLEQSDAMVPADCFVLRIIRTTLSLPLNRWTPSLA